MNVLVPFLGVLMVMLAGYVGAEVLDLRFLFGVFLPYAAVALFMYSAWTAFFRDAAGAAPSPVATATPAGRCPASR